MIDADGAAAPPAAWFPGGDHALRSRSSARSPSGARGFVLLAERPDELVVGVVGRFWGRSAASWGVYRDEFAAFARAGLREGGDRLPRWSTAPGGSCSRTETRIVVHRRGRAAHFGRYWRVVHPGSALIRREWLRAIRRRAEGG